MVVRVELRHEDNLYADPDEPDVFTNLSESTFVILVEPTVSALQAHWQEFQARLRSELYDLFTMTLRDLKDQFGGLGLTEASLADDALLALPYGFFHKCNRFRHLKETAVARAVVERGLVPRITRRGAIRTKMGFGHVTSVISALDLDAQHAVLKTVVAYEPIDEFIKLSQTCLIGAEQLGQRLDNARTASSFLTYIANQVQSFHLIQKTSGNANSKTKGSGRIYSAAWFSQYLSACGVWLQPLDIVRENATHFYPPGLKILSARMAVQKELRPLADAVFSKNVVASSTSAASILTTFIAVSACSNIWRQPTLSVGPLIALKKHAQENNRKLMSTSINSLYRVTCDYMKVDLLDHKHADIFHQSKRLAGTGVDVFEWAERPNSRNTNKLSSLVGEAITEIPSYIKEWCRLLKSLLPLFNIKNLASTVGELNYWIAYLYMIGEELAPKDFIQIDRGLHVNSMNTHYGCFVSAMSIWYAKAPTEAATRAIPTIHKAWTLASARYSFPPSQSNPFDPSQDKIGKTRPRHGSTVRRALDEKVLGILTTENRRDDFAFARSISGGRGLKFQHNLKNTSTLVYESVFVPDVPILIDVIMSSGMRNGQARWLDSGEGDEFAVDTIKRKNERNNLATATADRRQGFLRIVEIQDGGSRPVLGMYINTNKTGYPYEVPWIDPIVVNNVVKLRNINLIYFPLRKPVQPLAKDVYTQYVAEDLIGEDVYPLFRDLGSKSGQPVSENRVYSYWRALLNHCQPIIDRALNYAYPLVDANGSPLYDIHSLRVTTVTVLIENGVSPEIVQQLVGHRSVMMTWYYNAIRGGKVHASIQEAMEVMKRRLDQLLAGEDEAVAQIEREHFTERSPKDFLGIDFLKKHLDTRSAPLDVFAHGICPGGSCRTGGERLAEGRYAPVWRDRACSRCRYRVTGPAFLNGLVHRLNGLLVEIKQSIGDEGRLNAEAAELEDRGRASARPRANARRVREERDEIFREWCAELKTVKACEALLGRADPDAPGLGELIALQPAFDASRLSLRFDEVHDLGLLQTVLSDSRILVGGSMDVPRGAEEWRDRLIHKILRTTELGPLLYKLDEQQARTAMDRLGEALLAAVGDPGELQMMIEGVNDLTSYPSLLEDLKEVIDEIETPRALRDDAA